MRITTRMIFPQFFAVILALSAGICGNNASAQDDSQKRKPPSLGLLGNSDGGIAAIKNAPFSGEMVCESTQTLADGNRIVSRTKTMIYRDGAGRIRRESSGKIRSVDGSEAKEYKMITIIDHFGGQIIMLDTQNRTARKVSSPTQPIMERVITARTSISDPAANKAAIAMGNTCGIGFIKPIILFTDNSDIKDEPLGTQMIEGVAAEGTRVTHTIPVGSIDNERPIEIVFERWYSQDLQLFVLIKSSDPRSGESTGQMTNINIGEPDATLFEIPPDYKVQGLKTAIPDNSANTGAEVFDITSTSPEDAAKAKLPREKNKGMAIVSSGNLATNGVQPMTADLRPTILYKEKGKYTEEALRNRIEGTVILNVVFTTDGKIMSIRVVRGLPDGLTEKAIEAAHKIRFNPAVKDGVPVSVRGNLEFTFVLDK
jgi:TonB family protein